MALKNCVIERLEAVSDNVTTFDMVAPQHDPGELFCLQLVSFMEETHEATTVVVGFRCFDAYFWLETYSTVTHDVYYNYWKPVWVPSDYRLVVRFTGADVGDKLHVNILGYYMPDKASET